MVLEPRQRPKKGSQNESALLYGLRSFRDVAGIALGSRQTRAGQSSRRPGNQTARPPSRSAPVLRSQSPGTVKTQQRAIQSLRRPGTPAGRPIQSARKPVPQRRARPQ